MRSPRYCLCLDRYQLLEEAVDRELQSEGMPDVHGRGLDACLLENSMPGAVAEEQERLGARALERERRVRQRVEEDPAMAARGHAAASGGDPQRRSFFFFCAAAVWARCV